MFDFFKKANKTIKSNFVVINNKVINLAEILKDVDRNLLVKGQKDIKYLNQFGFEVGGRLLIAAGSSTKDDTLIADIVTAIVIAILASYTGGIGGALAGSISTTTLRPVILGALSALNTPEKELGEKLLSKSQNM